MKAYWFTDDQKKQLSFSRSASFCEHTNRHKLHGSEVNHQVILPVSNSDQETKLEVPRQVKQEVASPKSQSSEATRVLVKVLMCPLRKPKERFGYNTDVNHVYAIEPESCQEVSSRWQ